MGPSIEDVARRAGVGKGTVSRVLNNMPGVSNATAARVRQAMSELGYSPNVQARRLARNVSDLICFVLSNRDFLHEFHSMVLKGVGDYCSGVGRDLVFALWRYELEPLPQVVVPPRIVSERGSIDGVVLAGENHVDCAKMIARLGMPCVSVGNNLVGCKSMSEVDSVWYDEAIGTRDAIRYLAELGHRHIRFLASMSLPWFARNYRAYSDAMLDLGLAPMATCINDTIDYAEIAERGAMEILSSQTPTTAIFAGNDIIAAGVIQSLQKHGVRVPQDISIIGFDDAPRCTETDPNITTVQVPKEKLGAECARFLTQKISSKEPVTGARVIPTKLVIRDSCSFNKQPR